jgi:uncharacterized protein (TIGR01244 family)
MQDPIQVNERFVVGRDQPAPADIPELARRGFHSIVNLRPAGEEGETMSPEAEGEAARDAELAYLHLPVAGDELQAEAVDRFRAEVAKLDGPVFVHCGSGKRAGAFTLMHLAIESGTSGAEVVETTRKMGITWDSRDLQRFVRDYVDARRRFP